jgi:hypothetical protein
LIADIEPQHLREMMVHGILNCAPTTRRGVTRVWAEDDIMALKMFRQLTRWGWRRREAGRAADQFRLLLQDHPGLSHAVLLFNTDGFVMWQTGTELNTKSLTEAYSPDPNPIICSWHVFALPWWRFSIRHHLLGEAA